MALAGAAAAGTRLRAQRGTPAAAKPFPDVKLLVFDTFGTVVDWRAQIIAEGEQLSKAKGLKLDWAAFADEWRGAYGPSMNKVRSLDVLHRTSLDTLLARHGIAARLTEAEKAQFNRVWHRGRPWPDSVPGLTRLKSRFTIAPLSNGNLSLLTNMAKAGGLPWDCILGAELVRHYKPDPEVYLSPVEFFDLTPPEVMMVAAHQTDLQGPKRLGLRTAYVHRPYEGGSAGTASMPAAGTFDLITRDLREVAALLGT
jgi:2-haloacid dehalogenase